jgi:hypothetical protein
MAGVGGGSDWGVGGDSPLFRKMIYHNSSARRKFFSRHGGATMTLMYTLSSSMA